MKTPCLNTNMLRPHHGTLSTRTLHFTVRLIWCSAGTMCVFWVNSKAEKQAKKRKKHGKIRWQFTLMSGEKSIRSTKCLAMFSMLHTNRYRCVLNTLFLNWMTLTGELGGHSALIALKNYLVTNQCLDQQGHISDVFTNCLVQAGSVNSTRTFRFT